MNLLQDAIGDASKKSVFIDTSYNTDFSGERKVARVGANYVRLTDVIKILEDFENKMWSVCQEEITKQIMSN